MNITLSNLKPFQIRAGGELASMVLEYPSERFKARFDSETGCLAPFLCRLRAITGAGKTPILALTAQHLKNGIVLWTTNRGAIISQTRANLATGKYSSLLPQDTSVYVLGEMSPQDWEDAMGATGGITILLATVASFNQDGDKLKVHQDRGGTTYWRMLSGEGPSCRQRPLYVFYDEGHGATDKQFHKLRELDPRAFVLASASPLPEDLADLLSGRGNTEREQSLQERTVYVPTRDVVTAGLLKNRLYFVDCDTAQADAVQEANDQWNILLAKLAPCDQVPIACFIVNDTRRGIDVWEQLVNQGIPKGRIAVHLNGAEDVMVERSGASSGLVDTYKAKKSPEDLRIEGYTHIIWNMTLREGWDEPLAYVGYLDSRGRSTTDIVQKIGRFVRQPNATPFDDPDLNSAYFYFNVPDNEFTALLKQTQAEMEVDGYEIIGVRGSSRPTTSRMVDPSIDKTIPMVAPSFGNDIKKLDKILLDHIPLFSEEALQAKGRLKIREFDMERQAEDEAKRAEREKNSNEAVTVWDYLTTRLAAIDSRIVSETGTRFSSGLKDEKKMQQRVQYGSDAMQSLENVMPSIRDRLNDEFRLVSRGRYGIYRVRPFKLVSPDITGTTEAQREKYMVRCYSNAVHAEYNGMNPEEVALAEALDVLGNPWCRNPANKDGYGIPIAELGAETTWFYPDFLLWTDKEVWALDPKGKHLLEGAVQQKLLDLTGIEGLDTPIRVALVLKGSYAPNPNGTWTKAPSVKGGFTLIRRTSTGPKAQPFDSLFDLTASLVA